MTFSRGSSTSRIEPASLISPTFTGRWASLVAQLVKNLPAMLETWVRSLGWEESQEKGKATTPVFWPGEFHGLYSPWGRKESDTTERLSLSFSTRATWKPVRAGSQE